MNKKAFTPYTMAGLQLSNRIVMAPMTRTRATDTVPDELTSEYYGQRATAGLIITEGVSPAVEGQGFPDTPGLFNDRQVAGWLPVTGSVHESGGKIFAQLMHVGRIGDPDLLPEGVRLLAPSAVAAPGQIYTHVGMRDYVEPKAMTEDDIHYVISEFARAAANAVEAGFDGVEIHGANGYLVNQFLSSNVNLRTDEWGGSIEGRIKFAVEVTKAVVEAIGADRVGFRISPKCAINDIQETATEELYPALLQALAPYGLAYLHISEGRDQRELTATLAAAWHGTLVLNPHTTGRPTAAEELDLVDEVLEDGTRLADLIAFGAYFISNPDLVYRLEHGADLTMPDRETFYGRGPVGYTDWPVMAR